MVVLAPGLWEAGVLQRWLDEAQKVNLVIEEKDDDKDAEFQTSIFSNPDAYTQVYKVRAPAPPQPVIDSCTKPLSPCL